MRIRCFRVLSALVLLAPFAFGQTARLLADIHQGVEENGSTAISRSVLLGNRVLFLGSHRGYQLQPYVSDGTQSGTMLLKQLQNELGTELVVVGKLGLFQVGDFSERWLWVTDGTPIGTRRLVDLSAQGALLQVQSPMVSNGTLAFFVLAGNLWVSDGTVNGTRNVSSAAAGSPSDVRNDLVAVPKGCYFKAKTSAAGSELWFSDGTTQGTRMVSDWTSGPANSPILDGSGVAVGNGLAYEVMLTLNPEQRQELYTDGTAKGTVVLNGSSSDRNPRVVHQRLYDGNKLWLVGIAQDRSSGIWTSGVTAGSCRLLRDAQNRQVDGSNPFLYGSRVGFQGFDPQTGNEVWVSDGTPAGTQVLFESKPGPESWRIRDMIATPKGLFVTTAEEFDGARLFAWGGSVSGLRKLSNAEFGGVRLESLRPRDFLPLPNGDVFLSGQADVQTGYEPWISDGTAAGTKMVADLTKGSPGSSYPRYSCEFGGRVYFGATQPATGWEVHVSLAAAAGAQVLVDLNKGSSSAGAYEIFAGDRCFWFLADVGSGHQLFHSTGVEGQTRVIPDVPKDVDLPKIEAVAESGGTLFFLGTSLGEGTELYSTAFPQGATRLLYVSRPGPSNETFESFATTTDKLWFTTARVPRDRATLHVAKGQVVTKLANANNEPDVRGALVELGGLVYFVGEDRNRNATLWVSDGTLAGTRSLAIAADSQLVRVRDRLFFVREKGSVSELWISDGSPSGSKMLKSWTATITVATSAGSRLALLVRSSSGSESWISDGTSSGTVRLQGAVVDVSLPIPAGERRFFSSVKTATGPARLFAVDGATATASEVPLQHQHPSVGVAMLGGAAGRAFFSTTDVRIGNEPFVASYGAGQSELGRPCGPSGARLFASDPILGKRMQIEGAFAPRNSVGALLIGLPDASPGLFFSQSCVSHVDPAQVIFVLHPFAVSSAKWQIPLPIPNDPAFVDAEFAMQVFYLSATAPLEATQGIHARMGR